MWLPAAAPLAPNERIGGGLADRADAGLLLAAARVTAALDLSHPAHPDIGFARLGEVVGTWGHEAHEIFRVGAALAMARCGQLGLRQLLPPDRVWVGVSSTSEDRYGGFHHSDQGYRHLEMGAVFTRHGYLHPSRTGGCSVLVALDLLRSYVHDSLHYGSFREYVIYGTGVFRLRYGINRRDPGGASYSALDAPDAASTRNLGIIMEGATDREARTIARYTAITLGISEPSDPTARLMFHDTTGQFTDADRDELARQPHPHDVNGAGLDRYLSSMARYERDVNARYGAFLNEIGGSESSHLHALIVAAMTTGDAVALRTWLDERHGTDAFAGIFRRRHANSARGTVTRER